MKPPTSTCSRELLQAWLDDALSERQEQELAAHLSDCGICRETLEELAADHDEWSRFSDVLKREASHVAGLSRGAVEGSGSECVWTVGIPDSPADFAVHFLEPSDNPDVLGRLGEIDILEVIGSGGMGIVLKGFQPELNRPVAVKVLAPHLATSGAARQRFAREAQATAAIVHPHVMPILTVHSAGRIPFLVMPYVACESLQQRLDREGPLETCEVLRVGMQTAAALAAAHAQGLVHRDVKPANILLERGVDRVMLTDFGLARAADDASLTRSGVIAGTPQYMSPEQARGEAVDARSDLFSLGSVLYAMCTGRPPFRAETSFGILRRITDNEPRDMREVNAQMPAWLQAVVFKLLAKRAGDRFTSAEEVAELLEHCLAHVQQPTAAALPRSVAELGTTPSRVLWQQLPGTRRWRRIFAAGVAVLLAGVAGVAIIFWGDGGLATSGDLAHPDAAAAKEAADAAGRPGAVGENASDISRPSVGENLIDWDFGDEALWQLGSETEELEQRVEQLWDEPRLNITQGAH